MPDAPAPESDPAQTAETVQAADTVETAAEEQKRKFREALERKQGVNHPHDEVLSGRNLRGRGGDTNRHEFRRKSG